MLVIDYPLLLLLPISFLLMAAASWCGAWVAARKSTAAVDARDDFGVVLAATLTLLGLIIGFTFSMALTRYDQRKNLEEEEANAIGTEYLRVDLLPPAAAEKARALLRDYTRERILFYTTRDAAKLEEIGARTAKLQSDLWAVVRDPAQTQRDPVSVMIMVGMNDVINSQGYAQAAWWNRIPREFHGGPQREAPQARAPSAAGPAAGRIDRVLPDRRHRRSACGRNPHRPAESERAAADAALAASRGNSGTAAGSR